MEEQQITRFFVPESGDSIICAWLPSLDITRIRCNSLKELFEQLKRRTGLPPQGQWMPRGAMVSASDPGGIITYTLRPDGQHSAITAPGGAVTSFEYDVFGRQTALVDPSAGRQTTAYSYATAGVLTLTQTNPKGTNISVFDKYDRITSLQRQGGIYNHICI